MDFFFIGATFYCGNSPCENFDSALWCEHQKLNYINLPYTGVEAVNADI